MSAGSSPALPEILKLLAHDVRWRLLRALAQSDYRVHELVAQVAEPMNLVSYHLKLLRADEIVMARRSEADGRDVYYSLDLERLRDQLKAAAGLLHPALEAPPHHDTATQVAPRRVLFVCTHNSARSQMAEALLRHLSSGQIAAFSAGSHPTVVHPAAIRAMAAYGLDLSTHTSKSFSAFAGAAFDEVITVCDLAREICPTFPGITQPLHWGLPDPLAQPDEAARLAACQRTARATHAHPALFTAARMNPGGHWPRQGRRMVWPARNVLRRLLWPGDCVSSTGAAAIMKSVSLYNTHSFEQSRAQSPVSYHDNDQAGSGSARTASNDSQNNFSRVEMILSQCRLSHSAPLTSSPP